MMPGEGRDSRNASKKEGGNSFMSGIAGFFNPHESYLEKKACYQERLTAMEQAQKRRGFYGGSQLLTDQCGLSQVESAVSKPASRDTLFTRIIGGKTFAVTLDGEIYNAKELTQLLASRGISLETSTHAELLLSGYLEYGTDFVKKVNGFFSFAILDEARKQLHLFRDRPGVKPLFFTHAEDTFLFASSLKALLAWPGIRPVIDRQGLNEIFSIGPAKTPGNGTFQNIHEVLPGHVLTISKDGIHTQCYWHLVSAPHEDSEDRTIEKISWLLQDATRRQMISDVPLCTFLSGGVDSSLISAICAAEMKKEGKQLTTFSFDFTDNDKNFRSNAFQPSLDHPYVKQMADFLGSDHHYLECSHTQLASHLHDSVLAHDLPAMADVDASMLYFCSLVSKSHKVAITGECADEIFGGYPWFHKKECLEADTFPWTMDLKARKVLLHDDFLEFLDMDSYVSQTYRKAVAETPKLPGEPEEDAKRREISYLNLKWFMQTLLTRMDRTSMYTGVTARVPFADHRIIEYLWNVPWDMKIGPGIVKYLLREAGRGLIPDKILFRKKSPYPKTYDRRYELLLAQNICQIAEDSSSPILLWMDIKKLETFLTSPSDYGRPWYGQLMAGPQMLAYFIQINDWLKEYQVQIKS